LTNSSLQYVRDGIEEKYRIVAVVSMPQTAFSATGAGVKSSVLFLKKYSQAQTTKIQNLMVGLQDRIREGNNYLQQLEQIENDKKLHLKDLRGFENPQNLVGKALTDSEAYKEWKKEFTAEYNDRIDALKESLSEQYADEKQKALHDYPIFMAIAEDIGYDATGKPTNNNELDFISVELVRFIEAIESRNDSFFLSSDVDKIRLFFIQCNELQDRLDPLFYVALENIKRDIERKAKYQCVNLIQTCSINRGRFGHRPRNDPRFYGGEYPFIQTGDIVQASENNTQIKHTQTLNELGLKTSKLFDPPKLLFTIAANIGDTAILDYPSCFPDSIVALIPKSKNILLEYLNIYLKIIKSYVVELAPYAAQRNLNNQQLAQIPIVIPPKEIQDQVVLKMNNAYALQKQKELEAQRSLDSIDDYLLSELGVRLTESEENTIQNRVFYHKFSEIFYGRLDPDFNSLHLGLTH
jgi:type I restriction enzyme M protein